MALFYDSKTASFRFSVSYKILVNSQNQNILVNQFNQQT